jgi:hypothetical protein
MYIFIHIHKLCALSKIRYNQMVCLIEHDCASLLCDDDDDV